MYYPIASYQPIISKVITWMICINQKVYNDFSCFMAEQNWHMVCYLVYTLLQHLRYVIHGCVFWYSFCTSDGIYCFSHVFQKNDIANAGTSTLSAVSFLAVNFFPLVDSIHYYWNVLIIHMMKIISWFLMDLFSLREALLFIKEFIPQFVSVLHQCFFVLPQTYLIPSAVFIFCYNQFVCILFHCFVKCCLSFIILVWANSKCISNFFLLLLLLSFPTSMIPC